jgi:hypothetical protein
VAAQVCEGESKQERLQILRDKLATIGMYSNPIIGTGCWV